MTQYYPDQIYLKQKRQDWFPAANKSLDRSLKQSETQGQSEAVWRGADMVGQVENVVVREDKSTTIRQIAFRTVKGSGILGVRTLRDAEECHQNTQE